MRQLLVLHLLVLVFELNALSNRVLLIVSIFFLNLQKERQHYEFEVVDGRFLHKLSGKPLDTNIGSPGAKWIFVMSTSKRLYVGEVSFNCQIEYIMMYQLTLISDFILWNTYLWLLQKKKGLFHHSSFLAGGATFAAGRLMADDGLLKVLSGRFCFFKKYFLFR